MSDTPQQGEPKPTPETASPPGPPAEQAPAVSETQPPATARPVEPAPAAPESDGPGLAGSGSTGSGSGDSGASAVDREVADAMAGMSPEDLADLTLGDSTLGGAPDAPAGDAGIQLGRIEAIRGDDVFISLGGKSQGVLPKSQFSSKDTLAVGEPVEVVVDRYDRESDLLILSRKGRARSAAWDLLKPGDVVEGRVVGLNRGGLEVQLKGIKAFLPASQVDVMHVKDISIFLNELVRCEVMEIDRRGKNLTVSRRKLLEKDRAEKRAQLVQELAVGQVRKGVVGNLTDFGAFVDLGGVDGLIHISDMSHKQIKSPADVVKTGEVVEVKVLKIQDDKGKQRISLGLKQTQPDPWDGVAERFANGSTHRVRVVRLADFGAFVELEEGVEGLIPISEMSYSRIGKPQEVVEVGQTIDASILRVEPKRRRIALSIKQAQPDPWAEVMDSYTPDAMVDGKVTRLADFGAFVELAPGIEGMVHISELSDKRVRACSDVVKVGQEVKARVLKVDAETRRIGLSLKPASSAAPQPEATADLGKRKQRKKDHKLRGGLSTTWDWAGAGLDDLRPGSGA
jgi:small subunit ribosomal protein S1